MKSKWAIFVVVGFLALFVGMAGHAARSMSATYDEPLHLVGGYVVKELGDYRVDPENPPGFGWLYSVVMPSGSVKVDTSRGEWEGMREDMRLHWDWCSAMFFPPPNSGGVKTDFEGILWRGRLVAIFVGVLVVLGSGVLGWLMGGGGSRGKGDDGYVVAHGRDAHATEGVVGSIGNQLGSLGSSSQTQSGRLRHQGSAAGWLAGVLAVAICCLDPTLVGHSAIVKNDVLLGLGFVVAAIGVVLLVRGVTVGRVVLVAVGLAVGMVVKVSGLVLVGLVAAALLVRAIRGDWVVLGKLIRSRVARVGVVCGIGVVCGVVSWTAIWGVYGFRYSVSKDPAVRLPVEPELLLIRQYAVREREPGVVPDPAKVEVEPLPLVARAVVWANEKKVMPEAWCKGMLYMYAVTKLRTAYLFSTLNEFGWRYYFPAAVLMKWPLGALGLLGVAGWWGWRGKMNHGGTEDTEKRGRRSEEMIAVGVIAEGYFLVAVIGNMNIGVRHLIPMLPLVWGVVGAVLARGISTGLLAVLPHPAVSTPPPSPPLAPAGRRVGGRWVLVAILIGAMGVETVASYDRLVAFFNVPSRVYGPERLLGDSNLDWGQDLPKLVEWQKVHPDVQLSGLLAGIWPAEAYGLRYVPVGHTRFSWGVPVDEVRTGEKGGVLAVSATWLQEVPLVPSNRGVYEGLRQRTPREVLGGSIFLYDIPGDPKEVRERPWKLYWQTGDRVTEVKQDPFSGVR